MYLSVVHSECVLMSTDSWANFYVISQVKMFIWASFGTLCRVPIIDTVQWIGLFSSPVILIETDRALSSKAPTRSHWNQMSSQFITRRLKLYVFILFYLFIFFYSKLFDKSPVKSVNLRAGFYIKYTIFLKLGDNWRWFVCYFQISSHSLIVPVRSMCQTDEKNLNFRSGNEKLAV